MVWKKGDFVERFWPGLDVRSLPGGWHDEGWMDGLKGLKDLKGLIVDKELR